MLRDLETNILDACHFTIVTVKTLFIFFAQQAHEIEAVVRRFKTDLHNCVGYIQDPKLLKDSIKAMYQKHVQEDIVSVFRSFVEFSDIVLIVSQLTSIYYYTRCISVIQFTESVSGIQKVWHLQMTTQGVTNDSHIVRNSGG
jgi:hypothetical protein